MADMFRLDGKVAVVIGGGDVLAQSIVTRVAGKEVP